MLRTRELHALLQDVVDAPGECAVDGALLLTEKGSVIATAGSRNQRRNIGHACFRPKGRARVPFTLEWLRARIFGEGSRLLIRPKRASQIATAPPLTDCHF